MYPYRAVMLAVAVLSGKEDPARAVDEAIQDYLYVLPDDENFVEILRRLTSG